LSFDIFKSEINRGKNNRVEIPSFFETTSFSVETGLYFKLDNFTFQSSPIFREGYKATKGDQKYQNSLMLALENLPILLRKTKSEIRAADIILSVALLPVSAALIKLISDNTLVIICGVLIIETLKLLISSKTNILSNFCKRRFMNKVLNTAFYKTFGKQESKCVYAAQEMIIGDVNVYK
jgi:hypothetical protein